MAKTDIQPTLQRRPRTRAGKGAERGDFERPIARIPDSINVGQSGGAEAWQQLARTLDTFRGEVAAYRKDESNLEVITESRAADVSVSRIEVESDDNLDTFNERLRRNREGALKGLSPRVAERVGAEFDYRAGLARNRIVGRELERDRLFRAEETKGAVGDIYIKAASVARDRDLSPEARYEAIEQERIRFEEVLAVGILDGVLDEDAAERARRKYDEDLLEQTYIGDWERGDIDYAEFVTGKPPPEMHPQTYDRLVTRFGQDLTADRLANERNNKEEKEAIEADQELTAFDLTYRLVNLGVVDVPGGTSSGIYGPVTAAEVLHLVETGELDAKFGITFIQDLIVEGGVDDADLIASFRVRIAQGEDVTAEVLAAARNGDGVSKDTRDGLVLDSIAGQKATGPISESRKWLLAMLDVEGYRARFEGDKSPRMAMALREFNDRLEQYPAEQRPSVARQVAESVRDDVKKNPGKKVAQTRLTPPRYAVYLDNGQLDLDATLQGTYAEQNDWRVGRTLATPTPESLRQLEIIQQWIDADLIGSE